MRSLLLVSPGAERFTDATQHADASPDAIILDLGGDRQWAARNRRWVRDELAARREFASDQKLLIRIHPLRSELADGDLDAVMPLAPDGIILPQVADPGDISLLLSRITVREALYDLPDRSTSIVAEIANPAALLDRDLAAADPRLVAVICGEPATSDTESLSSQQLSETSRLVRRLALLGTTAAGLPAIDGSYPNHNDYADAEAECRAARQEGFSGKLAQDAREVAIINAVFAGAA